MKNKELYDRTVSILVDAYFNDMLLHRDPCGCAVGNLVANGIGCTVEKIILDDKQEEINWINAYPAWTNVFCTYGGGKQEFYPSDYKGVAAIQIDSTGYKWPDLAKIEKAFETAPRGNSNEDWNFNGLMAVTERLTIYMKTPIPA